MARGLPRWFRGKESTANAGDAGLITGSGRSSGKANDKPLQYSFLEKFHGQRILAGCSLWGTKWSDRTERLSTHAHTMRTRR